MNSITCTIKNINPIRNMQVLPLQNIDLSTNELDLLLSDRK